MPEIGTAERAIASNVVVMALETLTENKQEKFAGTTMVNGKPHSFTYMAYTITGPEKFRDKTVVAFDEPPIEGAVTFIDTYEVTDDEDDEDDDDDEDNEDDDDSEDGTDDEMEVDEDDEMLM